MLKMWMSVVLGLASLGISACATKPAAPNLDREIEAQPALPMHGPVAYKGFQEFRSSPDLNEAEKLKLIRLQDEMTGQVMSMQEETSKLKSLLFHTLASTPYEPKKVEEIKKRLVEINDQKMNLMFQALNDAEKILGRVPPEKRRDIYQSFFFNDATPRTKIK